MTREALRAVEDRCITADDREAGGDPACAPRPTASTAARHAGTSTFVAGLAWRRALRARSRRSPFKGGLPIRARAARQRPHRLRQADACWRITEFVASHVHGADAEADHPVALRGAFSACGRNAVDPTSLILTLDGFFADLGEAHNKAVASFAAAGRKYLQIDRGQHRVSVRPQSRSRRGAEGARRTRREPAGHLRRHAQSRDRGTRPAGMTILDASLPAATSVPRSPRPAVTSSVAEVLFSQINADAYFMEYDSDRAGGFEPLRFVPRGPKIVVLGLVTSKTGALESKDETEAPDRRGREVSTAGTTGALSPQCGFASTEEGNTLTEGGAVGESGAVRRCGAWFGAGFEGQGFALKPARRLCLRGPPSGCL